MSGYLIDNPLTAQHPDWFQRDAAGEVAYHVPGRHAFAGFDFAQPGLRRYLIDALLAWLTRYDLDGLRFDDSDLVPLDFLREIRAALAIVSRTRSMRSWMRHCTWPWASSRIRVLRTRSTLPSTLSRCSSPRWRTP